MILDELPLKGEKQYEKVNRTFLIDDRFYDKLLYLAQHVYDASVNQIVSLAIRHLAETGAVNFYEVNYDVKYYNRSYLIEKDTLEKLEQLKSRYSNLSISTLVNIAVHDVLLEEAEHLKDFGK